MSLGGDSAGGGAQGNCFIGGACSDVYAEAAKTVTVGKLMYKHLHFGLKTKLCEVCRKTFHVPISFFKLTLA